MTKSTASSQGDASAGGPPAGPNAALRFTIRDLLVLTLAVAVGTADLQWRQMIAAPLPRAMLLGVSVLLVAGLLSQAWRFLSSLRGEIVPKLVRADLAFSALWRLEICVVLLMYHVFEHYDARVFADYRATIGWWIDLVYCLAIITIVASTRQVAQSWWRWTGPFALLLAWVFSVTCFAVALFERLKDHAWRYPREWAFNDAQMSIWAQPTFWLTLCWAVLLPVTFGSIYFVARGSRARWRRIADRMLFGFGFTASALILVANSHLLWAAVLPYAQTPWHTSANGSFAHYLRVAVPFLLILGTTIAYRWTVREPVYWEPAENLPPPAPPVHERRFVLLLLAVVLAIDMCMLHATAADRMFMYAKGASLSYWIGAVFSFESAMPLLATCLIVFHAAVGGRWRHASASALPARELPWRRFLGVWLAVMATSFLALCTMALAGFAYWARLPGQSLNSN